MTGAEQQLSPLITFGPDLWLSDGPTVTGAGGFQFPTRMAVIRLPDTGGLFVWSPVALTQQVRAAVDQLGPVCHLIAPNSLHYTYLAAWAQAYPNAKVHAAPGLTEKTTGAPIHALLNDRPDLAWSNALDQVVVHGNKITTEVVFYHRASSTVLVTDLLQQMPDDWFRGWRGVVARLDLMTSPIPAVPRKFRLATTNKPAARQAVRTILDWPAERLVIAHGTPLTSGGSDAIRHAFRWLI